jgi:sterol desaturase/sphingolipid hydroxylase (fatty acid hydroxylase superfamily)
MHPRTGRTARTRRHASAARGRSQHSNRSICRSPHGFRRGIGSEGDRAAWGSRSLVEPWDGGPFRAFEPPGSSPSPVPSPPTNDRPGPGGDGPTPRIYLPALAIVAAATALIAVGWTNHWGGASFAREMGRLHVVLIGPATLTILAVILVVERLRPAQRRSLIARGHRQDALYTLLNAGLVAPLVVALSLSFVVVVQRYLSWIVVPRFEFLPSWVAIGLIFVAMDGCNWLAHLANHHIRVLWRFHELHHSQEDMSVLTVFRTHPLIHVSYLIALIPGVVLLANGAVPTALLVAYAGFVAFEHSNTNLGFGPLERIFVSPNYHRIHHKLDGPQDVNLGFALTIWDQLSRRAVFPTEETIRTDTGLPGRPLAVEQSAPRPRHLSVFLAQLWGPFRPLHNGERESA